MNRIRRLRAMPIAAAALLVLSVLGTGAVSAAQANWSMTVDLLPSTVTPGAAAGYKVTITNAGPSNISQLFLVDSSSATPVYISQPALFDDSTTPPTSIGPAPACNATGPLYCPLGALNADTSVTVTVAYTTPSSGSSFSLTFEANTSGSTFSDKGGNSHGDTLKTSVSTALSSDKNFAGAFALTTGTIGDATKLGPKNIQSTSVTPPTANIPVTVTDGSSVTFTCTGCNANQFGEWSAVNVDNGGSFALFPVTLTILGNAVPNNATTANIFVYHVLDDGTVQTVNTACTFATGSSTPTGTTACIVVTKAGNDFQIVLWTPTNGGVRGTYG